MIEKSLIALSVEHKVGRIPLFTSLSRRLNLSGEVESIEYILIVRILPSLTALTIVRAFVALNTVNYVR